MSSDLILVLVKGRLRRGVGREYDVCMIGIQQWESV
jgi:hypothetical protein